MLWKTLLILNHAELIAKKGLLFSFNVDFIWIIEHTKVVCLMTQMTLLDCWADAA